MVLKQKYNKNNLDIEKEEDNNKNESDLKVKKSWILSLEVSKKETK